MSMEYGCTKYLEQRLFWRRDMETWVAAHTWTNTNAIQSVEIPCALCQIKRQTVVQNCTPKSIPPYRRCVFHARHKTSYFVKHGKPGTASHKPRLINEIPSRHSHFSSFFWRHNDIIRSGVTFAISQEAPETILGLLVLKWNFSVIT